MKLFRALPLVTLFASLLTACGSNTGMLQTMAAPRALQAQTARKAGSDMQAQYFNVLLNLQYTPDGGTHFGFDRMLVEFADSQAKHIKLSIAYALQGGHFNLQLERSGIGMQPVSERVSIDNLPRRAEVAQELSKLSGSDEDNALLARLIKVIAPPTR